MPQFSVSVTIAIDCAAPCMRWFGRRSGETARYVANCGEPQGRVAKAILVSAIPPLMLKTPSTPDGTPIEVFDGLRKALVDNRAQLYLDLPTGPFFDFNREGAKNLAGLDPELMAPA
jgi:non-heme chloroperoxidase